MDAWDVVDRPTDKNVLDSTWAFKIKRYPDALIKKFKARFCARGDQQIEGVNFFETCASRIVDGSAFNAYFRSIVKPQVKAGRCMC